MKSARPLLFLLLTGLLCGCQDREARAENARLAARVTALERQVKALAAAQKTDGIVEQAAAQNCADDLARFLETLRQDNGHYPSMRMVRLPDSCIDLRVEWSVLKPGAYAFEVTGPSGRTLVRQHGP
ncbi:hypothetical protein [Deinococcus sp. S9]|uniref:hypothetical protein n=1 Tax=Deinococcus sp. S9 TaxID=2545754 RepID=UPI00105524CE|nr:hypothetical protein [Deinococcus sp. S9]TDE85903.1 hypothetical protein E0686_09695 [Deinococcus sp. S9]